ncbi:alpha/beta hydrolase [Simiduia curdlanivorans]|uniref:Alpha/beta fold hydrolase n=1 Tax=Simiduia curdlanivorans TaxID=1492769 RepID=A0ABV8V610_9GAMM|nr:alpha/beta hydrolase [Simiduia curdlanivorans]MDN3640641.1 alpha/beta hydrolase [Simiduia curdlanivorans]
MSSRVGQVPFIVFIGVLLISFPSQLFAESWWQRTKDAVHEVSEDLERKFLQRDDQTPDYPTPTFDPADPLVLAAQEHQWRLGYHQDAVWHSPMAVLEAGSNNGPTVILVHGLGQKGMLDWLPVIPALAARFHVVALDLPGFGRSALPMGDYSPENYAAVLEGLIAEFAHDDVYLVGHSMGAAVSLYFASQRSSVQPVSGPQLRQLILVDAAGILERTAFVKSLATAPVPLEQLPHIIRSPSASAVDFAESMIERVSLLGDPTAVLANNRIRDAVVGQSPNSNAALALVQTDFSKRFSQVTVPTAILWGAQDTVAPLRTGYLLQQQIAGAQLSIFPDAEHVPMASHTELFNAWLLNRLQGVAEDDFRYRRPSDSTMNSDLVLKHCRDRVITGTYKNITLNKCENILLDNVHAESLSVSHSLVELRNVRLESEGRSFSSDESVVLATNLLIRGKKAALVQGSRIDFAGATVIGDDKALNIKATSLLVFSVSELQSAGASKSVHGSFRLEDKRW